MGRRYRIRVSGKAFANPDPAMLAQIVMLIGRRLHAEQLPQKAAPADDGDGSNSSPDSGPSDAE
jgi:hypothetical protein